MKKMIFAPALVCVLALTACSQTRTMPASNNDASAVMTPDTSNDTGPSDSDAPGTQDQGQQGVDAN